MDTTQQTHGFASAKLCMTSSKNILTYSLILSSAVLFVSPQMLKGEFEE